MWEALLMGVAWGMHSAALWAVGSGVQSAVGSGVGNALGSEDGRGVGEVIGSGVGAALGGVVGSDRREATGLGEVWEATWAVPSGAALAVAWAGSVHGAYHAGRYGI